MTIDSTISRSLSRSTEQTEHLDAVSLHQFHRVHILVRSTESPDLIAPLVLQRALRIVRGVINACIGEEVVLRGLERDRDEAVGVRRVGVLGSV